MEGDHEDRKGVEWGFCHGVGAAMCCSLNCCQHFPCQMT
jgi:hypothetical protein